VISHFLLIEVGNFGLGTPDLTTAPRFDDIGYGVEANSGEGHRGCLITLKDHPTHSTDGEVMAARRRFRSPKLYT